MQILVFIAKVLGYLKSISTISYEIIRDIKKRVNKALNKKIVVVANQIVIDYLQQSEQDNLSRLEEKYSIEIDYRASEERTEKYKIIIE